MHFAITVCMLFIYIYICCVSVCTGKSVFTDVYVRT